MSLWKIAWRSIQQRSLASTLTAFSMALGVTLVVSVLLIDSVISGSFRRNSSLGYNMIVGAKGGKLQLVLNTVYHLSSPVENIPWSYYQEFTQGRFSKYTDIAIPCCMGDYFRGFRVVGTSHQLFDDFYFDPDAKLKYEFASGRNFKPENFFEGVLGSEVARQTNLKVGDTFSPTHGSDEGHAHDPFTVVGILKPSGTPNDRGVFVNMEGFYLLEGHAKPTAGAVEEAGSAGASDDHAHEEARGEDEEHEHSHAPLPEDQREVTSILLRTTNDLVAIGLFNQINEGNVAQAVLPVREIRNLFDGIVEPIKLLLLVLTTLIVIVSGIGILVSIYNSMSERRREIAIMRALGADRRTVMLVVLCESILLSLAGGLAGWALAHVLAGMASPWIVQRTGVSVGFLQFEWKELILIPGLILLASLVGYLPALVAYRTDVAKSLAP